MMQNYFVGIDGGGSKTHLRIESAEGKVLAEAIAGPANIRLSVEIALQSINEAFTKALTAAHLSVGKMTKIYAGFGLAGFEIQTAREEFLSKVHSLAFSEYQIQSDAYVACLGAHQGRSGSVIIVGTGVVGLLITEKRKIQVGGWGFPHGDEGGAAWLGLEATRQLLHFCDGRAQATPLLLYLKRKFANKVENITQWACYATASQYAELARDVIKYAEKNDEFAIMLLKKSAKEVEKIFLALNSKNNSKDTPFTMVGGLSPFVLEYLKPAIKKQFHKPLGDACDGALLMIRNHINQNK